MEHFEWRYRFAGLGTSARVVAMAASHHRLNYIHLPMATNAGLLESDTPKSPVRLRFGADSTDALFPLLFTPDVVARPQAK